MTSWLGWLALLGITGAPPTSPGATQTEPLSQLAVTRAVAPAYPPRAVEAGVEGLVVVLVSIGKDGVVTEASPVSQTVPPDLFPAKDFEDLAKQWRFDVPEAMDVDLVFAFQLVGATDDVGATTTFELPSTVTVRATKESGPPTDAKRARTMGASGGIRSSSARR